MSCGTGYVHPVGSEMSVTYVSPMDTAMVRGFHPKPRPVMVTASADPISKAHRRHASYSSAPCQLLNVPQWGEKQPEGNRCWGVGREAGDQRRRIRGKTETETETETGA
jgi:hypothetical protein